MPCQVTLPLAHGRSFPMDCDTWAVTLVRPSIPKMLNRVTSTAAGVIAANSVMPSFPAIQASVNCISDNEAWLITTGKPKRATAEVSSLILKKLRFEGFIFKLMLKKLIESIEFTKAKVIEPFSLIVLEIQTFLFSYEKQTESPFPNMVPPAIFVPAVDGGLCARRM